MNFTISLKPDLDYYKEAYSELVKSSPLKKYEPLFATLMIVIGLGLWYFDNHATLSYFPLVFSGLGVFELIKVYTSRKKWLKQRLISGVSGQEVKLHFTDDSIIHDGPFSSGNIKWIGIKSISLTNMGLILKPETGIAIYLLAIMRIFLRNIKKSWLLLRYGKWKC